MVVMVFLTTGILISGWVVLRMVMKGQFVGTRERFEQIELRWAVFEGVKSIGAPSIM